MTKHMARTSNGDELVVSYMLLPESSEQKALVTRLNSVPTNLQRALLSLVQSPEAQSTNNLADVLGRRTYADSGKTMFQVLHESKLLTPMSIDDVVMVPRSGAAFPLRPLLEQMGRIASKTTTERQATEGFNPHTHNSNAQATDEQVAIARNLLIEASMLEEDAKRKREQAFSMVPHLRPAQKTQTVSDKVIEEPSEEPVDEKK